jgi:hypothetical protein
VASSNLNGLLIVYVNNLMYNIVIENILFIYRKLHSYNNKVCVINY